MNESIYSLIGRIDTPFHGVDGKSAYELAVEHGFIGSETEWLRELYSVSADLAWDPESDTVTHGDGSASSLKSLEKSEPVGRPIAVVSSSPQVGYNTGLYKIKGANGYLSSGDYVIWLGQWVRICVSEAAASTLREPGGGFTSQNGVSGLMSSADKAALNDLISRHMDKEYLPVFHGGGWAVNRCRTDGRYMDGLEPDCEDHPPYTQDRKVNWILAVLNSGEQIVQAALDCDSSRLYMRRGDKCGVWEDWAKLSGVTEEDVATESDITDALEKIF